MSKAFGVALGLFGAVLFFYSVLQLVRACRSRRWPIVEAEVIEAHVRLHSGRKTRYAPVVRYRYLRNGRTYEGDRILFTAISLTSTLEEAEQFVARFSVGTMIPIRVSPTNGRLSVLEPGADSRWSWPGIGFAIMLIVIGLSAIP